jgi:hypothetical protein
MVQGLRAYYLIGGVIIQVVQGERMEIGSKKMDYTLRLEAQYACSLGTQAVIYGFPWVANATVRHKCVTDPVLR